MQKLNKVLSSRFLKFLEEQAEKDAATYERFYKEHNRFIKEGVVTDFTHKAALGKLLRYESSTLEKGKFTSLADYVKRMTGDQKEIYYLLAPNREAAESSPYFEVFRARNLEVLFMYDPWDEFVMEHLYDFDGKPLRAAEKADINVGDLEKKEGALSEDEAKALAKWLKEKLGDRVGEVRMSQRLVDSPAVVVEADKHLTSSMRRILKAAKRGKEDETEPTKQDFEINPRHAIMVRLQTMRQDNSDLAVKVAEQILDNARVAAGLLEDPRAMLKRLNELLEQLLTATPK
jgi:TNF receptor-associated protein 1